MLQPHTKRVENKLRHFGRLSCLDYRPGSVLAVVTNVAVTGREEKPGGVSVRLPHDLLVSIVHFGTDSRPNIKRKLTPISPLMHQFILCLWWLLKVNIQLFHFLVHRPLKVAHQELVVAYFLITFELKMLRPVPVILRDQVDFDVEPDVLVATPVFFYNNEVLVGLGVEVEDHRFSDWLSLIFGVLLVFIRI